MAQLQWHGDDFYLLKVNHVKKANNNNGKAAWKQLSTYIILEHNNVFLCTHTYYICAVCAVWKLQSSNNCYYVAAAILRRGRRVSVRDSPRWLWPLFRIFLLLSIWRHLWQAEQQWSVKQLCNQKHTHTHIPPYVASILGKSLWLRVFAHAVLRVDPVTG